MSVEVIGRAVVAPGANSPADLFDLLRRKRCTVTEIPADRWDKARYWHPSPGIRGKTYSFAAGVVDDCFAFDPGVFGMTVREAQLLDPQQRMVLQLAWRALEDANLDVAELRGQRVGVYVGASSLDHGNLVVEDPASAGPYFMTGNTLSIVSNRISHVFGLNGPSLTIDTACSSSLVALDIAVKALENGEVDTAIVGGVNTLTHPLPFVGFAQARMLSPEGLCRAYDNDGAGYVRSEGGAVVILRRSDFAASQGDRSHARILATGVNSAGRTNGISLPSRQSQANLLRSIYQGQDIDPNRLAFIEGHGTGTKVGDPAEIWSIGTVIGMARRAPIPLGSIKTNIGHTEPASGLLGLMKAILALEHNCFPASLHFETPNELVDFKVLKVHVASEPIELLHGKHPRLAGVNSFGFGGTNAHVVLSDPPRTREPEKSDHGGRIFMASAHTESALASLLASYRTRLREAPVSERRAIVSASGANRQHLRHRFVTAAGDAGLVERSIDQFLKSRQVKDAVIAQAAQDQAKIALVFSGNGSQWAGMGLDAYRGNAAFRDRFNVIHALFQVRSQIDLIGLLQDEKLGEKLHKTIIAQPLLFAIQAAMVDILAIEGIRPEAVFGHSVGEVAAAYVSGAISLVDAVSVVAKRSLHQERLAGCGKMIAVQLRPQDALEFCRKHGLNELCIAAINAGNSVTVSGPSNEIVTLRELLRGIRVPAQILDINYPFHHPLIESAKEHFLADMSQIALRPSQIPFISTVTGSVLDGNLLDAKYWWSNVCEPVQFKAATETALDLGCTLFVEVGPRPILLTYVKEVIKDRGVPATTAPTFLKEDTAADPVETAFARIIAHGGAFDRRKAFGDRNARIELPRLPFEPVDIRPEFTSDAIDLYGRLKKSFTLAGWRVDRSGGSWKNHVDAALFPDLAEHVVDGNAILPGSAFLDIAVSAARDFFETDQIEVSNLELLRPLPLSDSHVLELSTILSPDTGDIRIRSRERLSQDEWTLHAAGRCRALNAQPAVAPPPAKPGSVGRFVDAAAAYETARRFGLDYGPAFRLLEQSWRQGEHRVEVVLRQPKAAAHPFVAYSLHPIAVDAAFHGLVAIFDTLSGEDRGAPYIPVRFGAVKVTGAGQIPARAHIQIKRLSALSINVDIDLLDQKGSVIAIFEDCRFKRTYLRQPRSLEDVSIHQTAVARWLTGHAAGKRSTGAIPPRHVIPALKGVAPDGSTQMLKAAVYRACFDLASGLADADGRIDALKLPGDMDFRRFLANCLGVIEEVGLGKAGEGYWTVEKECSLPPVSAILDAVHRERPDRIAELTAVNDVYAEALERLREFPREGERMDRAEDGQHPFIGDATLDHLHIHTATAVARAALAKESLRAALAAEPGSPLRIVEMCVMSRAASMGFAEIAAEFGAELLIVEPREAVRSELALAFQDAVNVSVIRPADLVSIRDVSLVLSASDAFPQFLEDEREARAALGRILRPGGRIILAMPAPGVVADFVFGLSPGWFSRSKGVEFPVGAIAGIEDYDDLLRTIGLLDVRVRMRDIAEGQFITIEGRAPDRAESPVGTAPGPILVALLPGAELPGDPSETDVTVTRLDGETAMAGLAAAAAGKDVVLSPRPLRADEDGADWLTGTIMQIGAAAEALEAARLPEDKKPRLAVLVSGGSPAPLPAEIRDSALAAGSGLWTFLRVLRNERPGLDLYAIDISHGAPLSMRAIGDCLSRVSSNREWHIDAASGVISEIRAVPGPFAPEAQKTTTYVAAHVRQGTSSQISSIAWESCGLPTPAADEVVIAVKATGLNFRDVMWAMGMLPEEALEDGFAGATIGMECAGHILQVGSAISDLQVGDAVMAVAPAAFATHVKVKRFGVTRIPSTIDTLAAATLPVAFITAYYALVELARVRPGEVILIHGGAGGVGLAALQVAKARGAKVIATAGTIEKRRLLKTLGADHVFNSRSLAFVDDVMAVTGHDGVDIVLNSLFAESMERSLSLLKPFGRFLELGKRDFYADTKIGLRPFRRNVSYFGIDADQLLNVLPDLGTRLLGEISSLFEKGDLVPLPHRLFRYNEVADAFRLMQASGHIGKIVVQPPVSGRDTVSVGQRAPTAIAADGMHLVVGGIGGFGLAAANWLVSRGARKIALCSRRGIADADTAVAIRSWRAQGVTASLHACDVTDEAAVAGLLGELRAVAPLRSVVHAAMVLDDAQIANLTEDRVRRVVEPKARAAAILDRLTREDALDAFLMFSSATTLVGNPGQANYVAGNGYLEGLARTRRRAGLPALAVGFGAISDVGVLKRQSKSGDILSKRIGKMAMTAAQALRHVEDYLGRDPGTEDAAVVMIADIDWSAASQLPTVQTALFDVIARSSKMQASGGDGDMIDLSLLVAGKSARDAEEAIFQIVASEMASILRVAPGEITRMKVVKDVGLDSLMATELGMNFRQKTGFDMPLGSITQATTVGDIARKLYLKVIQRGDLDEEASEAAEPTTVVAELAQRHQAPAVEAG